MRRADGAGVGLVAVERQIEVSQFAQDVESGASAQADACAGKWGKVGRAK